MQHGVPQSDPARGMQMGVDKMGVLPFGHVFYFFVYFERAFYLYIFCVLF